MEKCDSNDAITIYHKNKLIGIILDNLFSILPIRGGKLDHDTVPTFSILLDTFGVSVPEGFKNIELRYRKLHIPYLSIHHLLDENGKKRLSQVYGFIRTIYLKKCKDIDQKNRFSIFKNTLPFLLYDTLVYNVDEKNGIITFYATNFEKSWNVEKSFFQVLKDSYYDEVSPPKVRGITIKLTEKQVEALLSQFEFEIK